MRPVVLLPILVAMLAGCEDRAPAKARPRRPASMPAAAPAATARPATSAAPATSAPQAEPRGPSPLDAVAAEARRPRPQAAPAPPASWRVVGVHDGDTLTAVDADNVQRKVRLSGIDAPEIGQPFGTKAREGLATIVMGKPATIHGDERDRYGRMVARVEVDGRDVNLELVAAGLAWHFTRYSHDAKLAQAELEARDARRGLWADRDPVPPWEWRSTEKARKGAKREQK